MLRLLIPLFCVCLSFGQNVPMRIQKDSYKYVLLCDAYEEEMMAVVINENKCMLIRKGDNMWKWINPDDIAKINVVSPDNVKEFEECANKYVEKYKEKIKGIFILQMKESYDEPVILKTGE